MFGEYVVAIAVDLCFFTNSPLLIGLDCGAATHQPCNPSLVRDNLINNLPELALGFNML